MKKTRIATLTVALTLCLLSILLASTFATLTASVTVQSSGSISSGGTPTPTPTPKPTPTPTPTPTGGGGSGDIFTISQSGSTYTYTSNTGAKQTSTTSADGLINDAINAASAYPNGIVDIDAGNYLLDASIVPQSNCEVNCASGVTIYQKALSSLSASISLVSPTSTLNDFTWNGGTLNGNKNGLTDHRGSSTWATYYGNYMGIVFFNYGSNDIVENATIENCVDSGLYTYEVSHVLFVNDTVLWCGDNPITFNGNENGEPNGGSYYDIANNCTVIGGQDVGINDFYCDNCIIENCHVYNVTQDSSAGASNWGIADEWGVNNEILNNYVGGCQYDIEDAGNYTLVDGNTVNGASTYGVASTVGIQIDNEGASIPVIGDYVCFNTIINCNNYCLNTYPAITDVCNLTLQGNIGASDSHETYYNLNVSVSGSGVVSETDSVYADSLSSINGNNYQFLAGDTVTLTATPNSGQTLTKITLNGNSASSPLKVVMSSTESVVATFS